MPHGFQNRFIRVSATSSRERPAAHPHRGMIMAMFSALCGTGSLCERGGGMSHARHGWGKGGAEESLDVAGSGLEFAFEQKVATLDEVDVGVG